MRRLLMAMAAAVLAATQVHAQTVYETLLVPKGYKLPSMGSMSTVAWTNSLGDVSGLIGTAFAVSPTGTNTVSFGTTFSNPPTILLAASNGAFQANANWVTKTTSNFTWCLMGAATLQTNGWPVTWGAFTESPLSIPNVATIPFAPAATQEVANVLSNGVPTVTVSGTLNATNFAGGAMNFGTNSVTTTGLFSGNGGGTTNVPEQLIPNLGILGGNGYVLSAAYGSAWVVSFSDTDAYFESNFWVRRGGSFNLVMLYATDAVNTNKIMGARVWRSTAHQPNGVVSWATDDAWNFPIPNSINRVTNSTFASTMSFADGDYFSCRVIKNDNSGGASGEAVIYDLFLVRQ